MAFLFDVCSQCVANYRALVHDPDAECSFCQIPFDCIMWSDEHPPAMTIFNRGHQACSYSVMRLVSARKWLWRTGQVPAELEQVWRGAQETIPDWPGFRRLTLSAEEMQDLDSCEEETASLMDSLRSDASTFAVSDEGGGVAHFSAHLPAPPTTDEARPPQSGDSTPPGGSHSVN